MKEERNPHSEKSPNRCGDQPRWRDLKVVEKNTAAELRRAKSRESHIDHQHHCPQTPQSETTGQGLGSETQAPEDSSREDEGWVCGDRLRGQGAVCQGLGSRTQGRRSGPKEEARHHCWGGGGEGGGGGSPSGISFPAHSRTLNLSMCVCGLSEDAVSGTDNR